MGRLLIARRPAARIRTAGILALGVVAIAGCGHADPQATADKVTRAVYADDLNATASAFDDATRGQVNRAELGAMSDKMHALGTYQSLAQRNASPDSGRYEYDATFSGGKLLVQLRLDPDGKVGAYRIAPEPSGGG